MNNLASLNERQLEAVKTTEGALIVLAGAGSGKTKMLISRIVQLIHQGVPPQSILAVTFTNKAAAEMKSRVSVALAESQRGNFQQRWAEPWMGFSNYTPEVSTFHSFCVKVLRKDAERLGFTRPFVIYDDSDQVSLIKRILESEGIEAKNYKKFRTVIDQFKCQAMRPEDVNPQEFNGNFGDQVVRVYKAYQESLRSSQAFDFGDLIVETYFLLKKFPDLLETYQERFRYLMVDEYQDTNRAQYLLVSLLAQKYRNLCVVGDEDQSIYKWRGADIRNILDFQRDYSGAKVVKLEQNYRSTQTIIKAASAVIKNNSSRYDKTLWTANEPGEKIRWLQVGDERAEGEVIAQEIQGWVRKNDAGYNGIAVFYRSHAQSRALEEGFRKYRVPYRIIGGVGFYERKEIKDVLAYLKVLVNPDDSISFMRIINVPARGIGNTTVDKVDDYARRNKLSFYAGLKQMLMEGAPELPPSAKKKLADFVKITTSLQDLAKREPISEVYHYLLEATGYVAELKAEETEEAKARIQNLEEFSTVINFFEAEAKSQGLTPQDGMLSAFLNQILLEASLLEKEENMDRGAVSMMTLHSSKGLEFPLVFMVGCEEGLFPSRKTMDEADEESLEEERRLCYVGITRARKSLIMSSTQIRRIYGQVQVSLPSRFLQEIPKDLITSENLGSASMTAANWSRPASEASRTSFKSYGSGSGERRYDYREADEAPSYEVKRVETPEGKGISVGQKVKHEAYGLGTVRSLEGSESDRKVTVEFTGKMTKKFSLKHVNLELV